MADTKCTGDHSVHICEFAKQEKFERNLVKRRILCRQVQQKKIPTITMRER